MSTVKVLNMAGAEVGTVELNDTIFGIEPNEAVVHEVVKNHLANCRQGSTRAPQWTHGGIVFAPKPRSYSYVLNKKVRRLALKSVLSAKAAEGRLVVIDSIKQAEIKTAEFRKFLNAVKVDGKAVVVTPAMDEIVVKSARNLPGVLTTPAAQLNVYDIVNARYLVVDQAALAKIEEVYA